MSPTRIYNKLYSLIEEQENHKTETNTSIYIPATQMSFQITVNYFLEIKVSEVSKSYISEINFRVSIKPHQQQITKEN